MKEEKKKIGLKKIILSVLLVIFLVLQIAFLSYLVKGLTSKQTDKNLIMKYNSNGNFDYKIYLKNNELVNSDDLGPDNAYILGLVDHISLTSIYQFDSALETSVTGNTKLLARLKVYYRESTDKKENPEVFEKEDMLKEEAINFNSKYYSSVQSADIYINEYLDILKKFQEDLKISVDGYLEISSESSFIGKVGGVNYNGKYNNILKIPLSNSVFTIDNTKGTTKTEKVYAADLVKTNSTVKTYLIVANIVIFLILMLLLKKLFMFTSKSEYERELSKILKNYDDIVVNTNTLVNVHEYKVIEIGEFKELLNLSRELLLPIMNYEVDKDNETWFYVVKDNILYRYIVSSKDLEEKKLIKEANKNKNIKKDDK